MATADSTKRPSNFIDMTGRTLGRWYVIKLHHTKLAGRTAWLCRCQCGRETPVDGCSLRRGASTQCDTCGHATHGLYQTREYKSWQAMMERCHSPRHKSYPRYGGKGITVCQRWRKSFSAFLKDMGPRPPKHSIERRNNSLGYTPDNCCWATATEQQRNTRKNRFLTFNGKTMCVAAWAEHVGIPPCTLRTRINTLGWSTERALTQPVRGQDVDRLARHD